MAAASPFLNPLSMATTSLCTPKPSLPFLHFPSPKPLPPLLPSFLHLKTNLSFTPLVAQTPGFASHEKDDDFDLEEEMGGVAGLSEWEGDDELLDGAAVVERGGEVLREYSEGAKLYVGNVPYEMDSDKLAQMFEKAGVVEIAEVIYNRETEQSRGFGFVTMSTVEEAEKAIEMFHRYEVNGRLLTVNIATPKGGRVERTFQPAFRVFVGNLPWQVDDARLEQVFSEHGKVLDARVVYERESGRSRGFGFVRMASQSEMDDAIAALDGQSLDGRAWRVNVAEQKPRRAAF